jgi:hypothetical protein
MPLLHDPAVRASVEARLARLTPTSRPTWGKMSVGQMLWHVNQAMETALGRVQPHPKGAPVPAAVMRFLVLNMPWTRNAPTNKAFVPNQDHDFAAELARCRRLVAEIAAQAIEQPPPLHPMFGQMTGQQQSQLHAKHLDHHLRQFGV